MNFRPNHVLSTLLFCYLSLTFFSCSKDSDLLSDYVITDASDGAIAGRVLDDTYFVSFSSSTVLDVLANDNFEEGSNVVITGTSEPAAGQAIVNEDNTITYIPDETATEDSFNYLTEQTQGDGTVSSGEGTVTIAQSGTESRFATTGTNVYYVTINGKSTNNGKSESASWDLGHAVKAAKAGDIVYIKAGLYSDFNLTQTNNGTSSNPIRFVGYKSAPGDISPDTQVNYSYAIKTITQMASFTYGDEVDSTKMPLLQENNAESTAFDLRGNFVEMYNFQVKNYGRSVSVRGNNCRFINIIAVDQGSQTTDTYNGWSIWDSGSNNNWNNIYIENAGAQGFTIDGENNTYNSITVVCDNSNNPTDYYYLFQDRHGIMTNNETTNLLVKRVGDLAHDGHGLVYKSEGECTNVNVADFILENIKLEVSGPGVHNNTIKDGIIFSNSRGDGFMNIRMSNGSYNNELLNIHSKGSSLAFNTTYTNFAGSNNGSDGNIFNQCTFDGNDTDFGVIRFQYFDTNGGYTQSSDNNTFYNCTFTNSLYLYENSRANKNTKFINCIFKGFEKYTIHRATSPGFKLDVNFQNCNFSQVSFSIPTGSMITNVDPQFVNPSADNFTIKNPALLGRGIDTPYLSAGNDIGAFQN